MTDERDVDYIHVNTGTNRRDRRHGYTRTGKHYIIPKEYRELATNEPYIREDKDNVGSPE